ncbi:inositol monophosphatase family protein [Nodosilinea sp. LEGE 07298]|uniref:3'(2'),5'-bisphosphate nucleotidase CysQ family protein n=1 Tax=Nodosilinea sp. LEGE 07298 TaxID=2777970 RepID=UPI00187E23A8|nr:inositol monophosphatase family protein [Nodosilinea sp. LEGE 07298]MBE9109557.1 inositol monophosphatase family protein [Nodosilinea sp. LEGE 07298]
MSPINPSDLSALHQLLVACGDYASQQSQESFQVFEKGIDDYVTTVDRLLDQKILAGMQTLFPKDGIITEENRATAEQFQHSNTQGGPGGDRPLWFVDPIDGTDDFIQGRDNYSVMVGRVVGGMPQAGWIYAPVGRQLVWGGPNWGLFEQTGCGHSVPLIPKEPPFEPDRGWAMVIGDKDARRFGPAIAQRFPNVKFLSLGSFGLKVLAVITGQAGIYIYLNGRVKLWDTTGPLALAEAAGLVCCDLTGQPIRFTEPDVAPHTLIHQQPIVVGWPSYVEALRSPLSEIAAAVGLPGEAL